MPESDGGVWRAPPAGPFGYGVCAGCGVAVPRRVLAHGHECDPERYAAYQASRLHWRRQGFEHAMAAWLASPSGRFAQFYARRLIGDPGAVRPGEA